MLGDFTANLPSYLNILGSGVTGAFGGSGSGDDSDGGIDWGNILGGGISTAESILKAQFGTPNLNPGTYIQSGPNGTTAYRLPNTNTASFGVNTFPGLTTSISPLVMVLVGVGVLILLIKK